MLRAVVGRGRSCCSLLTVVVVLRWIIIAVAIVIAIVTPGARMVVAWTMVPSGVTPVVVTPMVMAVVVTIATNVSIAAAMQANT
jgi:hypothetical protein